jgi:hypothetical protein
MIYTEFLAKTRVSDALREAEKERLGKKVAEFNRKSPQRSLFKTVLCYISMGLLKA